MNQYEVNITISLTKSENIFFLLYVSTILCNSINYDNLSYWNSHFNVSLKFDLKL